MPKPKGRQQAPYFLDRVEIDPITGCHLFRGHVGKDGYGRVWHEGTHLLAHRLSWMVQKGPIPDGLDVLHHCDVGACINPEHLFLGTHSDNMQDMIRKGRQVKKPLFGEACPQAKLNVAKVRKIRRDPRPAPALAREFKVHPKTVRDARRGITWASVI